MFIKTLRNNLPVVLLLTAFLLSLAACYGRAYVSGGKSSSFDNAHLQIKILTGSGDSYYDRAEKTIFIYIIQSSSIGTRPTPWEFSTKYKIVAGGIEWDIEWRDGNHVVVHLYEFPPGMELSNMSNDKQERIEKMTPLIRYAIKRESVFGPWTAIVER